MSHQEGACGVSCFGCRFQKPLGDTGRDEKRVLATSLSPRLPWAARHGTTRRANGDWSIAGAPRPRRRASRSLRKSVSYLRVVKRDWLSPQKCHIVAGICISYNLNLSVAGESLEGKPVSSCRRISCGLHVERFRRLLARKAIRKHMACRSASGTPRNGEVGRAGQLSATSQASILPDSPGLTTHWDQPKKNSPVCGVVGSRRVP